MAATALRRKGPGGEGRNLKPVESIIRAAGRMNRLIGDLLDVSLIEAGRLGIERARVSTRQLLTDALDAQRPLTAAAAVELRLDLAPEVPDVIADRDRLIQVFENLIGNAIKFVPAGGCVIVGAAARGTDVLFWVADTGPGISTDAVAHLFDRFWQAAPRRSPRRGPRPADRQGDRGGARRPHLGREHARTRDHLLLHDPRCRGRR